MATSFRQADHQEGFERPLKAKLLLVIDQLEELFAMPKETTKSPSRT